MNVQIYVGKMNFDAQKAERWFKERRIPFQSVDMKKHKIGQREMSLFIKHVGSARALVDPDAKGARADYARHLSVESVILDCLMENPSLIASPIVRNGAQVTLGYHPEVWETWV